MGSFTGDFWILAPFSQVTLCSVSHSWSLNYNSCSNKSRSVYQPKWLLFAIHRPSFCHIVFWKKNRVCRGNQLFLVWQPPAVNLEQVALLVFIFRMFICFCFFCGNAKSWVVFSQTVHLWMCVWVGGVYVGAFTIIHACVHVLQSTLCTYMYVQRIIFT